MAAIDNDQRFACDSRNCHGRAFGGRCADGGVRGCHQYLGGRGGEGGRRGVYRVPRDQRAQGLGGEVQAFAGEIASHPQGGAVDALAGGVGSHTEPLGDLLGGAALEIAERDGPAVVGAEGGQGVVEMGRDWSHWESSGGCWLVWGHVCRLAFVSGSPGAGLEGVESGVARRDQQPRREDALARETAGVARSGR